MQTWLLWNMIGLYPVTGQTTFLIHSPWFESMTIDISNGNKLQITSSGGDGNGDTDFYVQSLKVNGENWTKNCKSYFTLGFKTSWEPNRNQALETCLGSFSTGRLIK
jgi:putative alpha-1,2-mannosidase